MAGAANEPRPRLTGWDVLARKWALDIVSALLRGPRRFSELRTEIPGLGDTVLSRRLAELESSGIVSRRQYSEIPPRVVYSLTAAGRALERIIAEIERLGPGGAPPVRPRV